uniref:Uncharacterized protein n=1 Tax=Onchocerca volvulus TaxID=6282 RepID=A0A8R1XPL6_ONCVO
PWILRRTEPFQNARLHYTKLHNECSSKCFFKFNSPIRFSTLQSKLPRGTHIESARGTDNQNFTYCRKETIHEEIGTRLAENRKRRSDIQADILKKYRRNEMTSDEMADEDPVFVMKNMSKIRF